jgi:hypothetical protein
MTDVGVNMAKPVTIPPPLPYRTKPSLGRQAAQASWMAPIVGVALNVSNALSVPQGRHTRGEMLFIGWASFAIYIFGLVLGIAALVLMRKYGRAGILVPAIIGVVINGLLVFAFTAIILMALSAH